MEHYNINKRYCPHEITTKINSVQVYRQTGDISYVCRKYKISKASLMRWNKQYDGTKESLMPKSHRPHSPHPNAHTEQELKWIKDYHRRNPNISLGELYGKLREDKAYSRHPGSLYRVFVRLGFRKKVESTKKKSLHNKPYNTPTMIGIKWQMDVKYVPKVCYVGKETQQFYQYTIIEEASRKRFIYAYEENSSYSTIDFVKRAITYFGYAPKTIQTDNGAEFTHFFNTKRVHPFDVFCHRYKIEHKLIRPRTPWHNGKVERSHRNDQERFYNYLSFYSFADLQEQMKRYLRRSNNIPMAILGWKSPNKCKRSWKTPSPDLAPTLQSPLGASPLLSTAKSYNVTRHFFLPFFGLTSLTKLHLQEYFLQKPYLPRFGFGGNANRIPRAVGAQSAI